MMELKVSKWKEFSLTRICRISMGNKFDNDKMSHENPVVNFVSRTAENNGVADFVDVVNGVTPYAAGSLTVALGGSIGSCFLQEKPFYTGQNVAVLEFDSSVSNMSKLFLSTLFMHECRSKFVAFGRELNTHIRTDLTLFLPVQHDASGQPAIDPRKKYSDDGYVPDWDFMEQYMKSLNRPVLTTKRGYKFLTLGVDKWKEFQVGRLFKLNIAKSVDYGNTTSGDTIFVGRTSENNGVQGYVSETPVEDGNCIIIGMVGSNLAFYQDKPFAASQNILVLRNDMLNRSIAMFLCTVLSKCVEIYRDTYSLPLGKEKIKSRGIKLPVQHDASGQPLIDPLKKYSDDGYIPDWSFMEQYIESLPGSDLLK